MEEKKRRREGFRIIEGIKRDKIELNGDRSRSERWIE